MYYYVYYSYEEWGRGYIGSRKSACLPEKDFKYFGSFKDTTFNPTQKIILKVFSSYDEALNAEIKLHDFYDVAKNPHFANRAKQTSLAFSTEGTNHLLNTRIKIGEAVSKRWQNPTHREKLIKGTHASLPLARKVAESLASKEKKKETYKKINHQQGSKNSQYGTMWITNGTHSYKINKNDSIPQGYRKGRVIS
jgi:hypothetical protein